MIDASITISSSQLEEKKSRLSLVGQLSDILSGHHKKEDVSKEGKQSSSLKDISTPEYLGKQHHR